MNDDTAGGLCPRCLMALNFDSRTMPEGEEIPRPASLSAEEMRERFPQFEILEYLGRGGMGVVYKARQKALDRVVAIKVLAGEWQGDPGFAARFEREAKTLAQMSHPNIVTVHDFGEAGGLYYLVMEFIDGVNLRDLLREGKMEPEQALAIVPPVCEALEYAHGKGVVHRDIKPENLLLDRDGRVKIADFGIASLVGATGEKSGTPPYMAPEQQQGRVDRRADIYALGVVLYEMLTGERPPADVVAPSRKVQVDVKIDEMVLRALEKEPERRYQTAGEFRTVAETLGTDGAGRSPEIPQSVLDAMSADPANWRWRFFYHCAGDPRLVVPKRLRGFGWTINFAQPWAIPFMAAVILVLLGSMRLAVATGYTSTANLLPLTLGLVAAVIGVCHSLSKGPVVREGYPPVHVRSLITAGIAFGLVLLIGNWHAGRSPAAGLTAKAWQAWRAGNPAVARPMFEDAVKVAPGDPDAWNGLGWSCFNSGDPKAGEAAFRKVIELEPDHAAALNGLGQIALARQDYDGAEPFLLKSAGQGASAAWHGLARLYLLRGDFAQAERWARKLVGAGDADGLGQQMLDAARKRRLPDDLRQMIGGKSAVDRDEPANIADPIEGTRGTMTNGNAGMAGRFRSIAMMEAALGETKDGNGWLFLDLESGRTAGLPDDQPITEPEAVAWAREAGLDLCVAKVAGQWRAISPNRLRMAPFIRSGSDLAPMRVAEMDELLDGAPAPGEGGGGGLLVYPLNALEQETMRFVFRTITGTRGILEFSKVAREGRRVDLEYLLMHETPGSVAEEAAPLVAADLAGDWLWEKGPPSNDRVRLSFEGSGSARIRGRDNGEDFDEQASWSIKDGEVEIKAPKGVITGSRNAGGELELREAGGGPVAAFRKVGSSD